MQKQFSRLDVCSYSMLCARNPLATERHVHRHANFRRSKAKRGISTRQWICTMGNEDPQVYKASLLAMREEIELMVQEGKL